MANARAIIFLLLSSLGALAQPFTQCELGWDYRNPSITSNSLTDGLRSYYRFEGNGRDLLAFHHLLTNGVITYDTGKITNGAKWDASPEVTNYFYLATTTDFQLVTNRTFAAWVKILDSADEKLILGKGSILSATDQEYFLSSANVTPAFFVIHNDFSGTTINYPNPFIVGVWSLVIVLVDTVNSNIVMQVDNDVLITNAYTKPFNFVTNRFFVGNDGTTLFQDHHMIDEMSVWNRLLTEQERTNLWNNGNGKTYPFNN